MQWISSVMKEEAHRVKGDKAQESGGWSDFRHGSEYQRPGHHDPSLDPNTKQGRQTLKKVGKLSGVIGARRGNFRQTFPDDACGRSKARAPSVCWCSKEAAIGTTRRKSIQGASCK